MIYIFILILLIVLSIHYDINDGIKGKCFWYYTLLILFVLLAGLRYRVGVDSTHETYFFFHETPTLTHVFDGISFSEYPLWKILNSFIFTIGGMWYWVQLIQAAFVNILLFKYFEKHSKYIFTCIFFYYIWLYAAINFEEMKASFAIVLSLYSFDYIIEKKYLYGIALLLLGCLFHPSAILVAALALMIFLRFNLLGILFLLSGFIIGYYVAKGSNEYLLLFFSFDDFLESKTTTYIESDIFFSREGKNIMYYLIRIMPLFLCPLVALLDIKHRKDNLDILKLEPYLIMGLFMVGISSSIVIFYRFNNFYCAIFILFISQSFVDMIKTHGKSSMGLVWMVVGSLFVLNMYFYNMDRIDKFYPYSSVIDKQVYQSKERRFHKGSSLPVPMPNPNEY